MSPGWNWAMICRRRASSLVCLPWYGPSAASSTVPTAKLNTTRMRAIGNPTPGAWVLAWGYAAWFSGVSGMVTVYTSRILTVRP